MSLYRYTAKDLSGKKFTGEVEAIDEKTLVTILQGEGLVILEKQAKNKHFARVLAEVVADVEGGTSLSAAFARHPRVFDIIYVKLVEAGETGGVLDKILNKLAESLEKDREFKAKTRGAFIYPAIVVV